MITNFLVMHRLFLVGKIIFLTSDRRCCQIMNGKQHGFLSEAFQSNRPSSFQLVPSGFTGVRYYKGNFAGGLLGSRICQAVSHIKTRRDMLDEDLASKGGCQTM